VVFPEAFQRDFGEPGSDLSEHAEPADGPFGAALAEAAAAHPTTVVAGMFETSPDPARPWNTLLARGAVDAAYRKIHLYDSFGYRESDLVRAGAIENTAYVVAVGQPGPRYTGHSMVVDPLGAVLAEAGSGEETLLVTFTRASLVEARHANPSLLNRRL